MDALAQIAAVVALIVTAVGLVWAGFAVRAIVGVVRRGSADPTRRGDPGRRWRTMLVQTLGHTKMLRWSAVGAAHWFVMVAFGLLLFTLAEAYAELFNPEFELPLLGGWAPYGLFVEGVTALCGAGIATLIVIRQRNHPRRANRSRFAGSTMWQGYFVEATIAAVVLSIFVIRGLRVAADTFEYPTLVTPISHWFGSWLPDSEPAISLAAAVKIIISMAWFIVIARAVTMGVAWHRFTAWFNIWFGRNPDGRPALGALKPLLSQGQPLDFEEADPDKDSFGAGKLGDFSWKAQLDFTTCTECGRCQSVCPAWNTGKPLSPKLLITSLRDHAYAQAPAIVGGQSKAAAAVEYARPLVDVLDNGGVIDPDVLWSCTMCGACVQECPVGIEHVDHIADLRRNQVLVESEFPSEAGSMLRNLETKGNPWGEPPAKREDWTSALDFEVPRVKPGEPLDDDIEYLMWVGCAGAFDPRARKTTQAVAELLHIAGVRFAILGKAEKCTGDPARRMGNEFTFVELATENVRTLGAAFTRRVTPGSRKVIASCAHCFNTLANEYPQLGGDYEVVHHSQLLARLVKEGRIKPTKSLDLNLTYHDPCYLGRHNGEYEAPRDVLASLPGVRLAEMPRNKDKSFCCGAGGSRMWMEETIGKRINIERTEEAVALRPDAIAAACPYCSVMLGDGIESKKGQPIAAGGVPDHVEVVDIARLLRRAVEDQPPAAAPPRNDTP